MAIKGSGKDCLVLSVIVSKGKGRGGTTCNDYLLAEGMEQAAEYLNSADVYSQIRGMEAAEFMSLIRQEPALPNALKPVVELQPVEGDIDGEGAYAQMFLCDTGPRGGIQRVHAQSPKYRCASADK